MKPPFSINRSTEPTNLVSVEHAYNFFPVNGSSNEVGEISKIGGAGLMEFATQYQMIKIFSLILILVLSCCKDKQATSVNDTTSKMRIGEPGVFSVVPIEKKYFDNASRLKAYRVEIDSSFFKKSGRNLEAFIYNLNYDKMDSIISFSGSAEDAEEEFVGHYYLGYYKNLKSHLVQTQYYEGFRYDLISATGVSVEIWSEPIFSHDGKYFFCKKDYGFEGDPVGLQIWQIKEPSDNLRSIEIENIFNLEQFMFNPKDVYWDFDNSNVIKAEKMVDNLRIKEPVETYYLRLKIK